MATVMVVGFWGWFALENFIGLNIRGKAVAPQDAIPIWFPIPITPTAFLIACVYTWRTSAFLGRAVIVPGVVESMSAMALHGFRNVIYRYEYDSHPYETKQSIISVELDNQNIVPGSRVEILVDPQKPSHSRLAFEFIRITSARD